MTHTQGPWVVKLKDRKWVIKGPDKKHSPVALVELEGFGMGPSRAVREANARLIAAAPDLYAAVKEFLGWGAMTGSDRDHFVRKFEKAIAKAEGGAK
jgi:hypothetical protein